MNGAPIPPVTPINALYWEGTATNELRLCVCTNCGTRFRFVRELCPRCWSSNPAWEVSAGSGKVVARVVVEAAPYEAMAARTPYVLALVELDEGVTMMSNVVDCDPHSVEIGQRVELLFEQRGDFAIPQFRLSAEVETRDIAHTE
ncbi:Nucleic-acid-binding protein containing a zn-ribbon [Sphingobium herbicidovorans NBRC 16415]|uniref:Nucleic-acid-binding protein containing a zn-ribbon n=1 Tax=Sphingobium herbicidovorans (strain ATCC 700291 / DSM 11019 / CCUG 56400 / KCTC 2939 / LMG 18315 / NBRC 16415 / MH) TaxID=1219045 RepID=A0A086PC11_SPHHM|nr:OB-fold domain-containing protein [Sphingobium herbicidovorans]KFG90929.1 Nucleic-acid-binding protein containing a zn-ribbon [Sphingobium herbicidovorans NBRC 16415]